MVPAWKARREVKRVWLKVFDRLTAPFERLVQLNYDANFPTHVRLTDGKIRPTAKLAIFFTYQPRGFAKSVFVSCEHLKDLGYTTLLVSSAPVSDADRDALLQTCWKIVERPNYGYDFGGYRDGVRVMQDAGLTPETLLIVNDSIWFPIADDSRMISNMEADDLWFNSPVFENKPGRNKKNQHFQSYLTLVKSKALRSAAFRDYWRDYRVSSRKRVVLLRGEKGFSQAMFKAGFGGDAPSTRSILIGHLHGQTNEFLCKTLQYAAYENDDLLIEARALLESYADNDDWRDAALVHMQKALVSTQPMGAFCYACIKLLNFSFMKKSSYPVVHDGMRWQYLRAVRNGDLPAPHPDVLAEIMASRMDAGQTTDPSNPGHVSAIHAA